MRRVVTASEVEAAATSGSSILIDDQTLVTPLARDRAAVLGVSLGREETSETDSGPSGGSAVERLRLESRVRIAARRALLARGRSLAGLDELVEAVMEKLTCDCGCERRAGE